MSGDGGAVGQTTDGPAAELARLRAVVEQIAKEEAEENHMFPRCGFRMEVRYTGSGTELIVTHSLGPEAEQRLAAYAGPLVAAVFREGERRCMELAIKLMEAKAALEKQPTLPGVES